MNNSKNSINEFLNQLNNKIRLSDFIGQFVQLTERGNSFVGKCPFHNENTPSFNVSNDKSLFYCFGCKAGGNIINFLTKYKNVSFNEATNFLSNYSGIPFQNTKKNVEVSNAEKLIYAINKECNEFFQHSLYANKFAYKYLLSRGLSDEVVRKYKLGFCPEHEKLISFLNSRGYELDQIKQTDFLIQNKKNEFFGRFSKRITFPIFNFSNFLVGFGGRDLGNSKIKYINSQENLIFKKSQILFGLNENIEFIRKKNEILLVEGYMDVIKLYNSGLQNSVSSMGTTLSEFQINKMWQYSDVPIICFDGDQAGFNASMKIAMKLLKFLTPGKSVKFMRLPNAEDPDSFIEKKSVEDFINLKEKSLDLSEFMWEIILSSITSDTPEFLATFDQRISDILKKIENSKISSEYFKFLKSKKDKFIWEKNKINFKKTEHERLFTIHENINEKIFLAMLCSDKGYFDQFDEEIFKIKLTDKQLEIEKEKILLSYSESVSKEDHDKEITYELNQNLSQELADIRKTHIYDLSKEEKLQLFKQIISNLKLPILLKERKSIQKEMMDTNDEIMSEKLLKKYHEISKEIKVIQNKDIQ